ncbi:hypothetical protein LCGC14_0921350 [marine sediment metagenome]|uniref:Uncharacterized protein n=1 Tax=marine sediment metagenome TaxID=412755 RepID=A0A0F9R9I5_9ZZZZ
MIIDWEKLYWLRDLGLYENTEFIFSEYQIVMSSFYSLEEIQDFTNPDLML